MSWWKKEDKTAQFETVLQRLVAAQMGTVGSVTPENCMKSPTVHAIVTAVSRRVAVTPVHVYQTGKKGDLATKEQLPNHPVAKLLKKPNDYQTRYDYWQDAASAFMRYGAYIAYIGRGTTGPIRMLNPLVTSDVTIEQDENFNVTFKRSNTTIPNNKVHYVRGPSRDFISPNSPVTDISIAIALEIEAENTGAAFFANGAIPLMILQIAAGSSGFKTQEEERQFIADFQQAFGGGNKHKAMLLPKGIEKGGEVAVDNDKAQSLETRKYQRTVIAGAFGVPPHLVGDLERATFNNVEQQDSDFTLNVVMPVVQAFEAAMEKDLLTDKDRANGIIIRFNLDSVLRADFKSRQEGLRIQRDEGVISSNEWRELEGKNPIKEDDGGNDYIRAANFVVAGEEPDGEGNDTVSDDTP